MRYAILVALLLAGLVASSASAKPLKAKPSFAVTAAKKSGSKAKIELTVSLQKVNGCKGSVTASAKLSKKRTAKWSGKLKPNALACAARITVSLPVAKFGKTVKFSFEFPGNKSIRKFSASKSLSLVPPPPPTSSQPAPTPPVGPPAGPPGASLLLPKPGKWGADITAGNADGFYVYIQSDATASIAAPANFKLTCGLDNELRQAILHSNGWSIPIAVDIANSTFNWISGANNMQYHANLHFSGANAGSGSLSANGSYDFGGGDVDSCSGTVSFDLFGPLP